MKRRNNLLATASGIAAVAAAGGVQAADMRAPMKAPPPMPPPAPSWTGFYIGGNLGAAWQQSHFQSSGYDGGGGLIDAIPISGTNTKTSFIGGGQVGYNWQSGSAVYGVEADISGLGNSGSSSSQIFAVNKFCSFGGNCTHNASSKIDWVATFRGRLGLAFTDTMVYATAGLAVGHVKNSVSETSNGYCGSSCAFGPFSSSSTKTGLAVGGGVEHMLSPNWTVRLEAMFIDLGHSSVSVVPSSKGSPFTATFSNQMVVGRVGLNYKF
jgi:outer membrane immunogenic protein